MAPSPSIYFIGGEVLANFFPPRYRAIDVVARSDVDNYFATDRFAISNFLSINLSRNTGERGASGPRSYTDLAPSIDGVVLSEDGELAGIGADLEVF